MSPSEKRQKRIFTHKEKLVAIQRINDGETKAAVSRDLNVPESTLRGWCKNEDKLRYMMKRLSTAKTEETSDGQPPEKRLRTISPGIQEVADGIEFKNPIAHQRLQRNEAYTPIDLATKKSLHSPPLSHLRHPNPGTDVSMSASIPFPEPHPLPVNNALNGLSFSEMSTIMNFLSHPYGLSSLSAIPKSLCALQSQSPAQYGKLEPTLPFQPPRISPLPLSYTNTPVNRETIQRCNEITGETPLLKNNHDTAFSVPKTKQIPKYLYTNVPNAFNEKESRKDGEDATNETPTNGQVTFLPKPIVIHAETNGSKRENTKEVRTQAKASSVLDNLLINSKPKVNEPDSNDTCIAGGETDAATVDALENGEKFLAWLETCGDPRVTHMHVHQLRGLLNNLRRRAVEPTTTDAARHK